MRIELWESGIQRVAHEFAIFENRLSDLTRFGKVGDPAGGLISYHWMTVIGTTTGESEILNMVDTEAQLDINFVVSGTNNSLLNAGGATDQFANSSDAEWVFEDQITFSQRAEGLSGDKYMTSLQTFYIPYGGVIRLEFSCAAASPDAAPGFGLAFMKARVFTVVPAVLLARWSEFFPGDQTLTEPEWEIRFIALPPA